MITEDKELEFIKMLSDTEGFYPIKYVGNGMYVVHGSTEFEAVVGYELAADMINQLINYLKS